MVLAIMPKDVLLIRSNQFHLAVPTDRLLEIVNLEEYHAQQDKNLEKPSHKHISDQHRLWRNHVLPVLHLAHYLEPKTHKDECSYGLVYQASAHETIYLDVDHVFGTINIDTSQMKPIYHTDKITYSNIKPEQNVLAFVLEDSIVSDEKRERKKKKQLLN